MATPTSTKARPIRAVKGSNFEPKRVRKAKRKALLRGMVGNTIADVRSEFEDRAEFYKNLRMIKLRRRHVAKEMQVLADMVKGLLSEVQRVENREPDFSAATLHEAHDLVKAAVTSVSVAADEFALFARNRVYYVKEL
ncbi:hypothetical protein ACQP1K_29470 (plasmid) [Sphaerimonospora sp. CA-214678]|uniref:hypothetical protein n=1 Tax=Sphaerimonospora sp. CA-214678 TaxID=3240029 RepID=UPI003D911767